MYPRDIPERTRRTVKAVENLDHALHVVDEWRFLDRKLNEKVPNNESDLPDTTNLASRTVKSEMTIHIYDNSRRRLQRYKR